MSDFSELIHKDFLHDARKEKALIYEYMNPCPKSKECKFLLAFLLSFTL